MFRPIIIYGLIVLLIVHNACTPVKAISSMYAKKCKIVELSNGDKTIKFIPMHHVGKPKFYLNVYEKVSSLKEDGYIVYYESAKSDLIEDSLQQDIYQRKFRKMLGFHIDSTGYAKYFENSSIFKNMIAQPAYKNLGVDDIDKWVDVSQNKLVDAYEQAYGVIELDPGDRQIPLNSRYQTALRLPKDNVKSIIIDYRNQHLAGQIQQAHDKKILVLYGALHLDGSFDELKKLDKTWKKK
jgi:hypothetical protein